MLKEGDKAPDFVLKDADGKEVALSDFKGKWIVLYFYPKDNTPGCTIEALDFTALKKNFEKKNAVILGVSKDACKSHKKFIENKKLTITLLSDEDTKVSQKYGVWRLKKFMGREYMGTHRSTFLINPNGKIKKIWYGVSPEGHAKDVLEAF
ncbi:MAG: thioredoxin-dependent thiol peroxidase [Candidatus Woesearchaeota archaeon]